MLKYLLDTNTVIYAVKKKPALAFEAFDAQAERAAISSIMLAELMLGAEKSSNPPRNLLAVEEFCSRLSLLDYGAKAASHYGQIRGCLERLGTPIGANDLHIAAHARSEGLTLVSNNMREFERVPGLLLQNWIAATF